MFQLQCDKTNIEQVRIAEAGSADAPDDGEFVVQLDRFAFTANNVTYAAMGERMLYWQFFEPVSGDSDAWGVIPVWGFGDVIASNAEGVAVGERLYGYFPPSTVCTMVAGRVTETGIVEGSPHRAELPPAYNRYARVTAEPGYDRAMDDYRALLAPLFITSFSLWDSLSEANWHGSEQILLLSASSKTSIGLAFGLNRDESAPRVIGATGSANVEAVRELGLYDEVISYDGLADLPTKPTVIVDMAGNTTTLTNLHKQLTDHMLATIRVGITHWDNAASTGQLIRERSSFFFAPAHIMQRIKDWGADGFAAKSNQYLLDAVTRIAPWLQIEEVPGLAGLEAIYPDICNGRLSPRQGVIVNMNS